MKKGFSKERIFSAEEVEILLHSIRANRGVKFFKFRSKFNLDRDFDIEFSAEQVRRIRNIMADKKTTALEVEWFLMQIVEKAERASKRENRIREIPIWRTSVVDESPKLPQENPFRESRFIPLIAQLFSKEFSEILLGDLEEQWGKKARALGPKAAKRWLWGEIAKIVVYGVFRFIKGSLMLHRLWQIFFS